MKDDIEQFKNELRELYPEGSTVFIVCRSVSGRGMTRSYSPICIRSKDDICWPVYKVAKVLGNKFCQVNGHNALKVRGCGMDMGWDLADRLSRELYGESGKLKHQFI